MVRHTSIEWCQHISHCTVKRLQINIFLVIEPEFRVPTCSGRSNQSATAQLCTDDIWALLWCGLVAGGCYAGSALPIAAIASLLLSLVAGSSLLSTPVANVPPVPIAGWTLRVRQNCTFVRWLQPECTAPPETRALLLRFRCSSNKLEGHS